EPRIVVLGTVAVTCSAAVVMFILKVIVVTGAAYAKLVGQKLKGMPLISIPLTKLVDGAASEAMANLSLELFKAFKNMRHSLVEEQERTFQLTKVISAEKERNETIQSQLDYYSKRQKFQKKNATDKADVSAPPMSSGLQNSPGSFGNVDLAFSSRQAMLSLNDKCRGCVM
ncbi:hypothetical protein CFP56_038824, partial [Quercus suber]